VLRGKAIHTSISFIVFRLNQAAIESKIYRTRGEQANNFTIRMVDHLQ
jgi:hypothetical protein